MQIRIQSEGTAGQTRVILVTDANQRIDLSSMVGAVTWYLDSSGRPARVLVHIEGPVSADLEGLLELATTEEREMREAFERMLEVPG